MDLTPLPVLHIVDDAQLALQAERWARCDWLTVDTEFVREDTYYPQLSLVQIGDGRSAACIDMLTITDPAPLLALFCAANIVKVLHSPSQDLEIFAHRYGRVPQPMFDTQLAATLLGIADQPGYALLVERLLGIQLDKRLARTPWLRRPLSDAELAYAAADVDFLARIYPQLRERLAVAGRLAWLEEDAARLAQVERYRPQPEQEWRRLKGLARLDARAQQVAARLAAWRERVAEQRDRPRKWILADDALYGIASRQPRTPAQLEGLRLLPPKQLERNAEALLDCVEQGLASDAPALVSEEREQPAQRAQLQRLQQVVRAVAEKAAIPPGLIAARADLERILAMGDQAPVPAMGGWRRTLLGDALLQAG